MSDPKLASTIKSTLNIPVLSDSTTQDLYRGIRQQLTSLLGGVDQKDLNTMSLGLGHSLSRFKLKFSTDKVDTMVIQAIALLDDLDKEINIYSMRVKVSLSSCTYMKHTHNRNGTDGTSRKWAKSLSTTRPMPAVSRRWASAPTPAPRHSTSSSPKTSKLP